MFDNSTMSDFSRFTLPPNHIILLNCHRIGYGRYFSHLLWNLFARIRGLGQRRPQDIVVATSTSGTAAAAGHSRARRRPRSTVAALLLYTSLAPATSDVSICNVINMQDWFRHNGARWRSRPAAATEHSGGAAEIWAGGGHGSQGQRSLIFPCSIFSATASAPSNECATSKSKQ